MYNNVFVIIYTLFLSTLNYINLNLINGFIYYNNTTRFKLYRFRKFNVPDHLLDPDFTTTPFNFKSPKYPPYPYYDTPKNLFFDISSLGKSKHDSDGRPSTESSIQDEFMKNAEVKRNGGKVQRIDKNPIYGTLDNCSIVQGLELNECFSTNYEDYIHSYDTNLHADVIKTDLAEYDTLRPGLGPWPTFDELKEKNIDLDTSITLFVDPNDMLERHLQHKPLNRIDIKTIAEARTEQARWLDRSRTQEWSLTYDEFVNLPLDMREAYYANRYPISDEDERFLMILNYRRSLGKAPGNLKNPLEFRNMESSYTYTSKDSPVLGDLKNWDDPLECPWRLRANEVIRDCVSYGWPLKKLRFHTGMDVYDITWLPGVIKILVERTRDEGDEIDKVELNLMLLKLEKDYNNSIKKNVQIFIIIIPSY